MFQDIRRHQKWLWAVISTAVIISFVVYFNPNQKYSRGSSGGGASTVGSMYGKAVDRSDYVDAYREAELRYLFSYGEWPGNDEMTRQLRPVERETRNRLLLIHKLKELNIVVPDDAAANWITEAFAGKDNKVVRKEDVDRFVANQLTPRGVRAEDFFRFARHEVGIQHLISVAGVSGRLVTPQEAEFSFRREKEEIEAEIALFPITNFIGAVTIDAAAVATYYTNQAAVYRVPERVQVSYLSFPASNYWAMAESQMAKETNLSLRLDQIYQQRGTNYYVDTNGAPLAVAVARERIRGEMRDNLSLVEARRAASEVASLLLDTSGAKVASNLDKLALTKGLSLKTSDAFSQDDSPKGMKTPARFAAQAFALTTEEPFIEEPVVGEDVVYVVALKRRLASEIPPLDSIRLRVVEDYRRTQALTLARVAGMAFAGSVTNALAQGKTFEAAAEANHVKYVKLSPFSQTTRSLPELDFRTDVSSVKNVAFTLQPGQVSTFTSSRDGGFVVHVVRHIPVSDQAVAAELASFTANLRRTRLQEAFSTWLQKEMELAQMHLPGDKDLN